MSTQQKNTNQQEKPSSLMGEIIQFGLVFTIVCFVTMSGLFMYTHHDKIFNKVTGLSESYKACPYLNNYFKAKNDQGIVHCVINAPFDEEIYKYTYWPNYREFKDKYYGKFEVIEKQMSHPINITFYDEAWKEVEAHSIHEMPSEEIAGLIRSKGFYEHEHKDVYRNIQKGKKDTNEKLALEKVKQIFESGTEEEKKKYEEALSALSITKEEFMNPELTKKNKEAKEAAEKKEIEKSQAERKKADDEAKKEL